MSETKCRKCGETCVTMTLEAFACDNCGDEYRTVREPGYTQLETELADKDKQLAEARAEIERLRGELIRNIQPEPTLLCGGYTLTMDNSNDSEKSDVERKDALIEQMRNELKKHCDLCRCTFADICGNCETKAALEAAERVTK